MLKESTRKGWAGVAATALVTAGLTLGATPAQAAPSGLTLEPVAGTSTTGVLGHYFVMKASAVDTKTSDDIAFYVEGITTADISGDVVFVSSTDDLDADEVVLYSGGAVSVDASLDVTEVSAANKQLTLTLPDGWVAGYNAYFAINLSSSSAKDVKITPWFENGTDNSKPDTNETIRGTAKTISFVKESAVTSTTSLALGAVGQNADTATVVFDINMQSVMANNESTGLGTVRFTQNGSTTEDVTFDFGAYSSTAAGYEVENTSTTYSLDVDDVLTAKAKIGSADFGTSNLAQQGGSPIKSMDANLSYSPQADVLSDGVTTAKLRAESGTVTVKATLNPDDDDVMTGHIVKFKIAEDSVNSAGGATFTAGGKTLSPTSATKTEDVSVNVAANAKGEASLTIAYSDFEDAETIKVTASTATDNGSFNVDAFVTFTAEDPTPKTVVDADRTSGWSEVVYGTSNSYQVYLLDQFGQLWTGSESRLDYSYNGNTGTTTATSTGIHTITFTDNNTSAAEETLDVETVDVKVSGSFSEDTTPTYAKRINAVKATKGVNRVVISGVASAEKNNDGTSIADSSSLVALDEGLIGADQVVATTANSFDVTVYDADGAPKAGAEVVANTDAAVILSDGTRQAAGTLTIRTNSSGQATFYYNTNSAAKHTITVTSGGKSDDTFIDFAPITDFTKVKDVALTAPATVQPGATLTLVATLKDKWGNPVNTTADATGDVFAFSWSGPGLVVGSAVTQTGSDGTGTIRVLMGQNDTGSGTATLKMDIDGSSSTNDDRTVLTSTVTIGDAPVDRKVNAGSFKGYVAVYARGYEGQRLSAKIGNDWVIVDPIVNNQENGTLHRTVDFTGAGVDIAVRIYIDRVLIDTINLTTK